MTKEEKLAVLEAAEVRAYGAVASTEGTDMGAEGFLTLLHSIEQLCWAQERLKSPDIPSSFTMPATGYLPDAPVSDEDNVSAHDKAEDQVPAPEAAAAEDEGPEPPTKEQVRAQLARYQTANSLDIPALMKSMGYSKLSEIPASQYIELLERAREWAGGEG